MGSDFTAELLLRFYREPARFQGEARRRDAPPVDNEVILKLALGRRIEFVDPELNEAGTATALKEAAALYVRHVFFRPDATPYQILGLAPGASAQAIKERFRLLMGLVHPDRQDSGDVWPDSFAALANRAYRVLRDRDARAAYDRDAEARARVARAVYRKAVAAEASRMPVPTWTTGRVGNRRPLGRALLPEWLTAGVGGYVRENPAVVPFVVLIASAALVVAMSLQEGPEGLLAREVREVLGSAAPVRPVTLRTATEPAPTVADAAPAPSRTVDVATERTERQTESPSIGSVSGAPESTREVPTSAGVDGAVAAPRSPVIPTAAPAATVAVASREPAIALPAQVVADTRAPATPSTAPAALPSAASATPAAPAPQSSAAILASTSPTPPPPGAIGAIGAVGLPPASPEIEAMFAEFVDAYERGRLDAFTALFDADAETNLRHGRAAIRSEYDELFRLSSWRRMQLTRIHWRPEGDRAYAKGEISVRIGWRDGREVEQRVAVDMELVRRDGRTVIARLSHQPKNP